MKRLLSSVLTIFLLFASAVCVSAQSETVLTLDIPKGQTVPYTGEPAQDAFALAVGYSLADDCVGLSGYAVTVRWDPNVLALNTDYREDMTDDEMALAKGCYFRDLYEDGLLIAPPAMNAVNYRNVAKGELTVVSIGLEDLPYRESVLFVLDMIPLCNNETTEITVEVKEIVGLMSSEGMIEEYRSSTTLLMQIGNAGLRGDADGDGKLTVADALLIKRHVCAVQPLSGASLFAADFDRDGSVNAKDYLHVCKKLQNK